MKTQVEINLATGRIFATYPLSTVWPVNEGHVPLVLDDTLIGLDDDGNEFFEGDLDDLKAACLELIETQATDYRAAIAGNIDPLKAAEYADKARTAERILNHEPVAPASIAEAKSEMVSLGLAPDAESADVKVIAQVWRDLAANLTAARTAVNTMIRTAKAAVDAAEDQAALAATMQGLKQQANALLAQLQGAG